MFGTAGRECIHPRIGCMRRKGEQSSRMSMAKRFFTIQVDPSCVSCRRVSGQATWLTLHHRPSLTHHQPPQTPIQVQTTALFFPAPLSLSLSLERNPSCRFLNCVVRFAVKKTPGSATTASLADPSPLTVKHEAQRRQGPGSLPDHAFCPLFHAHSLL